ncbi:type II toxin-antitoxin system PemI/MazE family antitoxin [Alkalibacterium kapii]|uniref:AbrB family transcriptional regulator n=1 Tax=Alkalibacterium kapii TaxID=426704 RepID=A0A511AS15_9LACT|nr:AbrB family transcriptional regulator [Alkalibacterium kapii]GEK90985.1 AbrB family transcriptional regulator [Alkalibacterium kapii]
MGTAKLRKQGRSVVVTIPSSEAKTLDLTPEYFVKFNEHGTIMLIPKLDNPFKHAKPGEYYEEDIWTDIQPTGIEVW